MELVHLLPCGDTDQEMDPLPAGASRILLAQVPLDLAWNPHISLSLFCSVTSGYDPRSKTPWKYPWNYPIGPISDGKKKKKKKNEANEKFLPVFHPGILRNRSFYRDLIWLIKPGIFSWSLHRNSYTLFISFSSSRPVEFPGTAKEGKGKTSSLVQVIPNILPGGKYWKRGYLQDIWIPEKELYPLRKKKKN